MTHKRKMVSYRNGYRWVFGLGFWVLGVIVAVTIAVAVRNESEAESSRQTADTANSQLRFTGEQLAATDICLSTDPSDVAQFGFVCDQARKVAAQESPSPVDTQALASAVAALVVASLPARVEAAVQRYMAQHPTASPGEVRDWVRQEVAANPPLPGKDGRDGKDGDPGRDGEPQAPTDAQVDAAVSRWFEQHPPNVCPGVWGPLELDAQGRYVYPCLPK